MQRYRAQVAAGEAPWNTINPTQLSDEEITATRVPEEMIHALTHAPVLLFVFVDLAYVASFDQHLDRVRFHLESPYPNPSADPGEVIVLPYHRDGPPVVPDVQVFDVSGRLVPRSAEVAAGRYFVRLAAGRSASSMRSVMVTRPGPLRIQARMHNDILAAMRLCEEFDIDFALEEATEAYRCIDAIKARRFRSSIA